MHDDEIDEFVSLIYDARNALSGGPCDAVTKACSGADAEWREALAALEKAIAMIEAVSDDE